jgi:SAM-dependent methyltransferase
MGNLAPVCHHFLKDGGRFVGVDTDAKSIEACLKTYGGLRNCEFHRTSDQNPYYPQKDHLLRRADIDWPVADNTQDMVIAMSVFTHLQELDAVRYLDRICRVLKPDGRAIISFLLVRDYVSPHEIYHFDHRLTPGWFTSNPQCPEMAIGITEEALDRLLAGRFRVLCHIEGGATGGRHPSPQDIYVLERTPAH